MRGMHRFRRIFQQSSFSALAGIGTSGAIVTYTITNDVSPVLCNVTQTEKPVHPNTPLSVLVGDIGGTNTRLSLIHVHPRAQFMPKRKAPGMVVFEKKYRNEFYKSFEEVASEFLLTAGGGKESVTPTVACFAVAGVVLDNTVKMTNIAWEIKGAELEKNLKVKEVKIINDFVAQGYGILTLQDEEVYCIRQASPTIGAPIGCIGAGTGLGETFLCMGPNGKYIAYPSEGGHKEWAPRGRGSETLQLELHKFLKIKFSGRNRISVERVVSGRGLCNIYEFLAWREPSKIDQKVHTDFMNTPHDGAIITKNAKPGSLCEKALGLYAEIYGAEAGVLALQLMPYGGLYVTGGVTMATKQWMLADNQFLDAFNDKGRVSPLLNLVPVYLVNVSDMGERGVHYKAVQILHELLEKHT